jgi:hypothetical protein
MSSLEEEHLEQLLQLFFTFREKSTIENHGKHPQEIYQKEPSPESKVERRGDVGVIAHLPFDALPLIKTPSHTNTRILVLLMQLFQL